MRSLIRLTAAATFAVLLSVAGTALPAAAATGYSKAPTQRLSVSCKTALPSKTLWLLYGESKWNRSTLKDPVLQREGGEWSCYATEPKLGSSIDVGALASGDKGFATQRRTMLASAADGSRFTKTSAIECFYGDGNSYSCNIDLLVHHVWIQADMQINGLFTGDPGQYAHAASIATSLKHAFRHGARGHGWKKPASAWKLPSDCSSLDATGSVGTAAGLVQAEAQPGEDGTDSELGLAAEKRTHLLKCAWWGTDNLKSLTATILPGASWLHVSGKSVPAREVGHGAKHVGVSCSSGSCTADVTMKRGAIVLQLSTGTRSEVLRAAKTLVALL